MIDPESKMRGLVEELRKLPEADPAAQARLQEALRLVRAPEPRRGAFVFTPARAMAYAAAIVMITSAVWLTVLKGDAPRNADGRVPVQFVFVHRTAQRVALVGDFNDWDPRATPLVSSGGVWSATVPLEPGRVLYSFIVDEHAWYADPNAPLKESDFGRPSSVAFVGEAEAAL